MFPIRDDAPREGFPAATLTVIVLNLAVFGYELGIPGRELAATFYRFGVVPTALDPLAFLTSLFLHGSWLHVIGNMWMLWIFGDNVEGRMGFLRYLGFYLLCGVLASVVHVVTNPGSDVPTIGASGAIAGVLGAYFAMYPGARVIAIFPIFVFPLFLELPAVLYLGLWFWLNFSQGTLALSGASAGEQVAWWAHIGGFAAGLLLHRFFFRRRRRRTQGGAWLAG